MQKYWAEYLGTYLLATAILGAITSEVVPVPIVAAFTLALVVYLFGGVSGAHVNPAITIMMLLGRKISLVDAGLYIIFQLSAGVTAALTASYLFGAWAGAPIEPATHILVAEALGTMILALGVQAAVRGIVPHSLSGISVGGGLFIGINIALLGSGAILNPAVAVATKAVTMPYLLGPIFGAIFAGAIASYLFKKTD